MTREDQAGKVYELAGDDSYTLAQFAAEIAAQSGGKGDYVTPDLLAGLRFSAPPQTHSERD